MVEDQVLTLEIEDIYLLTVLSQRGASIVLVDGRGGSVEPVDAYVEEN